MTAHTGEPHIVNIDGSDWTGTDKNTGRWRRLGQETGGNRLGCTLEEIRPGGRPTSYHYHTANEEAMYVINGKGIVRTPTGTHAIETGDYISFPIGEQGAHSVKNTSDKQLRCLFFSTMHEPDVIVYPDDGELQVLTGAASGQSQDERTIDAVFPYDPAVPDDEH
ncbi:cupin domain-containing protein [Halegenticoccus tardaugens]|uniref:cupin domain-containing protein n=1 Tax=Halegenticoccus tardaugens TaxID=2071624 RepID=UPI0013E98CC6|nr:cupin domain-containing protein [Halegenticoccus tardaugens]